MKKLFTSLMAALIAFITPAVMAVNIPIGIPIGGTLEGDTAFDLEFHNAEHGPGTINFDVKKGEPLIVTASGHVVATFNDNNVKRNIQIYVNNYSDQEVDSFSAGEGQEAVVMQSGLRGATVTDVFVPLYWAVQGTDGDSYTVATALDANGNTIVDASKAGYVTDIYAECIDPKGCGNIPYNTFNFSDAYANVAFALNNTNALLAAFPSCSSGDTNGNKIDGECGPTNFDFRQVTDGEFVVFLTADYSGKPAQTYTANLFMEIYTEVADGNHHF